MPDHNALVKAKALADAVAPMFVDEGARLIENREWDGWYNRVGVALTALRAALEAEPEPSAAFTTGDTEHNLAQLAALEAEPERRVEESLDGIRSLTSDIRAGRPPKVTPAMEEAARIIAHDYAPDPAVPLPPGPSQPFDFGRGDEHVVTGCEDCVVEHQGVCLLADPSEGNITLIRIGRACPDWCRLRDRPVTIRLEPDE